MKGKQIIKKLKAHPYIWIPPYIFGTGALAGASVVTGHPELMKTAQILGMSAPTIIGSAALGYLAKETLGKKLRKIF